MHIDIQAVPWVTYREQLLAIRFRVFVDEQSVPEELEHDAHDQSAVHLMATDTDGEPIGTARMLDDGHIGRMAVLSGWRGHGVGSALLAELLRFARQRGHADVFLHAQCSAESFYSRLGFVAEGGVFVDAGIDHRTMRYRLRNPSGAD